MTGKLDVWAFGCSHLGKDILQGRESLGDAITQSETPAFGNWDIAIDMGDHVGGVEDTPTIDEGKELMRQRDKLTKHNREQIYSVQGNHDREAPGEPIGWWFRRFVDPMGENRDISGIDNSKRPYKVDGNWQRYKFEAGNITFLMLSDASRPTQHMRGILGGDPGGVITSETFEWWKQQVLTCHEQGKIVVTCSHYLPKDTTICTGDYEGGTWDGSSYDGIFHGPGMEPIGSGRFHYIDDAGQDDIFSSFLEKNWGKVSLWLGAHSHTAPGLKVNNRGLSETRWGCHFINCAALTKYHGPTEHQYPRSRFFSFVDGDDFFTMKNWNHTTDWDGNIGWRGTPQTFRLGKDIAL